MPDWFTEGSPLLRTLAIMSPVLLLGSLFVVPVLIVRMRADFFVRPRHLLEPLNGRPAAHLVARFLKNTLGVFLLLAGVAMLVLPGQGLLTILLAIILLDFPGKRRVELWIVRQPGVLRAINALRERRGKDPLKLPPTSDQGDSDLP